MIGNDFLGGHQGDQVQRADVCAQRAQHTLGGIEQDVGEAAQAPLCFAAGLVDGEAGLDLGQPDPPVGGEGGHVHPPDPVVDVVEPVELLELHHGSGPLLLHGSPEGLVDLGGRPPPVGDRLDQGAGAARRVPAGPHTGEAGRHAAVGEGDGPAGADLGTRLTAEGVDIDRLTDGEDHRVGLEDGPVGGIEGGVEPALLVEHGQHLDRLQAGDLPVLGEDSGRPAPVDEADALLERLLDLELGGRQLLPGLEGHHGDLLGAHPGRRPGHVDGFRHRCPFLGLLVEGLQLVLGGPQGGAGGVHGHITAADHHHPVPHIDVKALVDVDEELDGPQHAVRLVSFDVQAPAQGGADRQEQRVVLPSQLLESDVPPQPGVEPHLDAQIDDHPDLVGQQGPIEPVLGDAEQHHPAQPAGCLVDGDLVAESPQIVSGRQTGRSPAQDPDAFGAFHLGRSRHLLPQLTVLLLRPELLGHEALERPDGDRPVDLTAPAGILTGCGTHPPAHGGEGVGQPGGQVGQFVLAVGDGGHVHPGVGVDRTGGQTGDVLVEVLQVLAEDQVLHQIRSIFCSQRSATMPMARGTSQTTVPTTSAIQRDAPATGPCPTTQDGSHTVASTKNRKMTSPRA